MWSLALILVDHCPWVPPWVFHRYVSSLRGVCFPGLRYFMICLLVNGQRRFPEFHHLDPSPMWAVELSQFQLIFKRFYVIIFIIVTIMVEHLPFASGFIWPFLLLSASCQLAFFVIFLVGLISMSWYSRWGRHLCLSKCTPPQKKKVIDIIFPLFNGNKLALYTFSYYPIVWHEPKQHVK